MGDFGIDSAGAGLGETALMRSEAMVLARRRSINQSDLGMGVVEQAERFAQTLRKIRLRYSIRTGRKQTPTNKIA
jgi:hypothetical protein